MPSGDPRTRRATLRAVLKSMTIKNGIIFCNRKTDVDIVAKSLSRHGFDAAPIHGDLDQSLRTKTLDRFRAGDLQLLVASDVAARGLDIPDVGHVFNFEPPRHPEDYIHRVGRTGRAGRSGEAFTLVGPEDGRSLQAIEKLLGAPIEPVVIEGVPMERLGDDRDSGGRGRRADELRNERSRKRDRFKQRDAGRPTAAMEPAAAFDPDVSRPEDDVAPAEPAPRAARPSRAERSREDRPPREDRPREDRPREERPRRAERTEARPPRENREPRQREDREPVMGFGEAAPAFLTRHPPRGEAE
jgi:superfamily II DNA/RNA helicase